MQLPSLNLKIGKGRKSQSSSPRRKRQKRGFSSPRSTSLPASPTAYLQRLKHESYLAEDAAIQLFRQFPGVLLSPLRRKRTSRGVTPSHLAPATTEEEDDIPPRRRVTFEIEGFHTETLPATPPPDHVHVDHKLKPIAIDERDGANIGMGETMHETCVNRIVNGDGPRLMHETVHKSML